MFINNIGKGNRTVIKYRIIEQDNNKQAFQQPDNQQHDNSFSQLVNH